MLNQEFHSKKQQVEITQQQRLQQNKASHGQMITMKLCNPALYKGKKSKRTKK